MKKQILSLLAIGALTLTGCQDDDLKGTGHNGGEDGPFAYINATIALPTSGSRSATDDGEWTDGTGDDQTNSDGQFNHEGEGPDYEFGYAIENDVRSMILVIAGEDNEYLTHIVVTGMTSASGIGKDYEFTQQAQIPYKVLEDAYSTGIFKDAAKGNAPKVKLYAYCNFTQKLRNQFDEYQKGTGNSTGKEWLDFKGSVEEVASMAGQSPQSTSTIWSPRSFLMTNAKVYETTFPETIEDWDQYADKNTPLDLTKENGAIQVERAAARLDFRDASENHDQKYHINIPLAMSVGGVAKADTLNFFDVQLTRMILVNMSKDFYYLRRVSKDGLNTDAEIGGKETNINYVVDANADAKAGEGIDVANAEEYFNFPLFDADGVHYNNVGSTYGWYISTISDILDDTNGMKDNWTNPTYGGQYYIWRYVTENTIPGPVEQQTVKQSTGIIFKAAILPGSDIDTTYGNGDRYVSELVDNVLHQVSELGNGTLADTVPALYSFHNMLYAGTKDLVRQALVNGEGSSLFFAVHDILANWYLEMNADETPINGNTTFKYAATKPTAAEGHKIITLSVVIADEILNGTPVTDGSTVYNGSNGTTYSIDFTDDVDDMLEGLAEFGTGSDIYNESRFIRLAPQHELTVFVPTNEDHEGWGYYCYYFYWNRHNDNNKSGKMREMEFATVRNNVYKLAVTKISGIGHPRTTDRDPDPLTPDTPDEDPENSIKVDIHVLPWVVRVNDIEF